MQVVEYKDGGIRSVTFKLEHKGKIYTVIRFYKLSTNTLYAEDISDENGKEVKDQDLLDQIQLAIKLYLQDEH
jgi:hypothetical protein